MIPTCKLTVVVPVYNEIDCLPRLVAELCKFLEQVPVTTSILFVDDGSTDSSGDFIEKTCLEDSQFHFLKLETNSGLSTALKAGFDACRSELIGYIDADLQTAPMDFLKFLNHFPDYDLVIGIRRNRQDNWVKKTSSLIANKVRRVLIHDNIEDTCCPLKIGKASFMKEAPFFQGMHRFIPALIKMMGGKVKQLPVNHFPRVAGTAKYNLRNRLVGPLLDTFAFRWIQHHYIHYTIQKQL
jgi:dolichol-phosphate mannosyltransferase